MKRYKLGFITDADLFSHVKETVDKYRFVIDLDKFNANIIDPIKMTFDAKVYQRSIEQVIEDEVIRQLDKSNNNHIGYFHQNIFRFLSEEWSVPTQGYDVVNQSKRLYVEMKNKHNTMNSSSSQKTYTRMLRTLTKEPKATCYLVEVIAKKSQNIEWSVSVDGERDSDKRIRRISIDRFYELVTGDSLAFKKLCDVLPQVIEDVVSSLKSTSLMQNTVLSELQQISKKDLLSTIYKISFGDYQGFKHD